MPTWGVVADAEKAALSGLVVEVELGAETANVWNPAAGPGALPTCPGNAAVVWTVGGAAWAGKPFTAVGPGTVFPAGMNSVGCEGKLNLYVNSSCGREGNYTYFSGPPKVAALSGSSIGAPPGAPSNCACAATLLTKRTERVIAIVENFMMVVLGR